MCVLGLALLVLGLALLTVAGVVAWRALHRWRRLWLLPITLVSLLVIWPVAEGTMLALAPRDSLGSVTPTALGLSYRDVTVGTGDGVRLSGWYLPSTMDAGWYGDRDIGAAEPRTRS
jgi:uncharacterized protein